MLALFAIKIGMKHAHLSIPNHSLEQARLFFSLAKDLNYPAEIVKRRAKLYFSVDCFNAISSEQINQLIDRLLLKMEEREGRIAG
jgi:hypothetical protein